MLLKNVESGEIKIIDFGSGKDGGGDTQILHMQKTDACCHGFEWHLFCSTGSEATAEMLRC